VSPNADSSSSHQKTGGRVRLRVAVIIRVNDQILLVNDPHYRGGGWILPGGAVELGETTRDAAVREVHEETGINVEVSGFWRFREIVEPDPDDENGKMRRTFEVFLVATPLPPGFLPKPTKPDIPEVADCRWVRTADLWPDGAFASRLPTELLRQLRTRSLEVRPWESASLPNLVIDPVSRLWRLSDSTARGCS
jgi:8-oxo-dGTP pyrophosphatase MutT (NUDIX family)